MQSKTYDVAIIGAGPAGVSSAIRASQKGASVALIEKDEIGGTCLNCGCIPTKFLWQALKTKQKIQKSYEFGFKTNLETPDFSCIISKKDKAISNLRKGMQYTLSSYPVDFIKGNASFKNQNTLFVKNDNLENEISAKKIIIATGTRPLQIKGFEFNANKILSSTDVLNLKTMSQNMLIIGGGAIGVEMATILSGFNCKITIAELKNQLMPGTDADIATAVCKNLQRQGVEVLLGCTNAFEMIDKFEKVLIVMGRSANNNLNLENANIEVDKKGFIKTNKYCQTNVESIYAVGDICGKNLLAYTAQNEGLIASENAIFGNKIEVDDRVILNVVFSMPQSASAMVKDFNSYKNISYGKFPFTASGRAFIENERAGFVKCAVDLDTKRPVAFWINGENADELINTAVQILKNPNVKLSRENFFHPSLSETIFEAYEDAFGKSTEMRKK